LLRLDRHLGDPMRGHQLCVGHHQIRRGWNFVLSIAPVSRSRT
jgi:hypothetical protein